MRRAWLLLATALAACSTSNPKPRVAHLYANELRDINEWHPQRGAEGHYAYNAMMVSDPLDSVPVLISRLSDMTPTTIDDGLHPPVPVGDVAFHILMRIFGVSPETFEDDGVWVMESDPSKNPIYMVKFRDEASRDRVAKHFHKLAVEREWLPPAP